MSKSLKIALAGICLSSSISVAQADKADNSINVGFTLQLQSLDYYYATGRESLIMSLSLYDALVYRNPKTFEFEPLLSTAYRQIEELTLEFDIRQGVKFHDGSAMTAQDVVYTLRYVSNPENKVANPLFVSWIDTVDLVGQDTVRIKAKRITPLALSYLSELPIYSQAYYSKVGKDGMASKPVGTGPLKAELGPNNTIIYTRFDDYFEGGPKGKASISKVVYKTIPDVNTQVAELMTGGIDWAYYIPEDQAERLRNVPSLSVVNAETFRVAFLLLDAAGKTSPDSPLKNLKVRQAIAHSLNRDSIVKNLNGKSSKVLASICDPKQFGCVQDVQQYSYDVEKAKALMAEAGYKDGFSLDILGYRSRPVAEAVVNNLAAIGINANLQWLQYPAVVQKRRSNQAPMIVDDWGSGSFNDVSAFLPNFYSGGADDFAMDPVVEEAVKQGEETLDKATRQAAYTTALKRIAEQVYNVPLFTVTVNYVFNKDLDLPVPSDEFPEFWRGRWK